MVHIYPNLEKSLGVPSSSISAKTGQLHLYIAAALVLVKEIDNNMNILVSKFGLESMSMGTTDMNNTAGKCQSDTDNMGYKSYEKVNAFTYTTTGFPNAFDELPADNADVAGSLTVLKELAVAMKTNYDEMLSLLDKLQENENSFSGFPQVP